MFVLTETWLVPIEGWIVDRFGPRVVVSDRRRAGGDRLGHRSIADSLPLLYVAAALGGIGAGAVYGTCVGNALKWFPDRRGLAAGLTAAGFGAGAAATVVPIRDVIAAYGYQSAFLWFGLGQGVDDSASWRRCLRRAAAQGRRRTALAAPSRRATTPGEMLRTPLFWVLYVMFVLVAAGGLMATAQLASIATDYRRRQRADHAGRHHRARR